MEEKKMTYEESYAKLSEIVTKMEQGQMTLDESIKAYEEGMKLLESCEAELQKYEKKISELSNKDNSED